MLRYLLKRLSYGMLVVAGVVCVVFFLFHALPGDPVSMIAGQRSDIATREAITKELGLDRSLPEQFQFYLADLSPVAVHSDTPEAQEKYDYTPLFAAGEGRVWVLKRPYLRRSFQTNQRVDEILLQNLEPTLVLACSAMLFATFLGIALGVLSAINQGTALDGALVTGATLGISIPSFVSATLIAYVFGYLLHDLTGLNTVGQLYETDVFEGRQVHLENLILPTLALGIRPLSIIVQLTRSSMLEVLSQDYIRTARAKGLRPRRIIFRHALKNALNPVVTSVSGWLASLIAGAFFIEIVFDWKGFGYVTINAVQTLNFPVVMGATLFIAVVFVIINVLVDMLYVLLDPQVRLR